MVSLGCSKNLVDAEQMLGLLNLANFELVENEAIAEVIIVNTCCFVESAKKENIETILEMAEHKQSGNCKILIVSGCMAQRYKQEVIDNIPEVDAVIGTGQFDKIADIIRDFEHNNIADKVNCDGQTVNYDSLPRFRTTPKYTAYLKIAEGCDNSCTYCIIPSIRGKYTSRKMEDIVKEAEEMTREGVVELILIAQDTTSYGKDIYGELKLPDLLKKLCAIDGIVWIRLHYCYPELISDELIDVIANNDKICKYLDIPIQHSNNLILQRMNRRTTKEQLAKLIKKLRARIPDIAIRTTVMVGFPGEQAHQFAGVLKFIREHKFDRLGAFTYSQEEGTPAAEMIRQVKESVKQARYDALMLTHADILDEVQKAKVGKTFSVLVEGYDKIIEQYYGRTYADSIEVDGRVYFTTNKKLEAGEFVNIKMTDYWDYDLFGDVAE